MDTAIDSVLGDFLKVKGVAAAAVIGRDGFVIQSTRHDNVDVDALGAMVAAVVGTSESLAKEFSLGDMDQHLTEFGKGKVIMATAVDDILAVFTDASAVIGGVRYAIRKNMPNVVKALQ